MRALLACRREVTHVPHLSEAVGSAHCRRSHRATVALRKAPLRVFLAGDCSRAAEPVKATPFGVLRTP